MIALLRGEVAHQGDGHLVLDVGGVGYRVQIASPALLRLRPGEAVSLHVHTRVREDAIDLYGFALPEERSAFEALVGVSGIGPRLAAALLLTLPLGELVGAIEREDLQALARAPGVGRRTAQRIVVELKGRLVPPAPAGPAPDPGDPLPLALARLGYRQAEIVRAQAHLAEAGLAAAPLPQRLQAALRLLSGGTP